jgi:hypothetical protein
MDKQPAIQTNPSGQLREIVTDAGIGNGVGSYITPFWQRLWRSGLS